MRGKHDHVRTYSAQMPRRLGRAIERCLARRRDKRWPAALVLARELDACATDLLGERDPQDALSVLMAERGLTEPESEPGTKVDPAVMHETDVVQAPTGGDTRVVAMALLMLIVLLASGYFFLS
jgi:hypothetical protein